jgi:spermidine synthase
MEPGAGVVPVRPAHAMSTLALRALSSIEGERSMGTGEKTRPAVVTALMFIYLASGACSLIDEVIWLRLLKLSLGNTVYASGLVVSVFMAGLAIGAFLMGRWSDGIRKPLRLYAVLELGIAGTALLSPWTLHMADEAYVWFCRMSQPAGGWLVAGRVAAAASILLAPTLLMGATLPLLGRFVASVEKQAGPLIGRLYALNMLGAAAGCFLAGFVLMGWIGVIGTLRLAAAVNLLVALAGYVVHRVSRGGMAPAVAMACPVRGQTVGSPGGLGLLAAGFFLSGAVSIGYELLWMRSVVHAMGAFTFVFSAVLTVYLIGNVLGASIGTCIAREVRNPGVVYAGLLCVLGVCGVLYLPWLNLCSYTLLPAILHSLDQPSWQPQIGWSILSPLVQSTVLFLVPSIVMGMGFPVMLQAWVDRAHRIGWSTGAAYSVNTWGAVAGGLLTGFALIPLIGLQAAIVTLGLAAVWVSSVMWVYFARPVTQVWLRRCVLPLAAIWITLLGVWMPGDLFRRTVALNRWMEGYQILDIKEGINTTVSLHRDPRRDVLYLCTSGRKVAGTSRAYRADQKMLGHFPVLLNEHARSSLSVGFGSGESTACLAMHGLDRVDCAEIAPELAAFSLKHFGDINSAGGLHERVNMIYQDVRNYLHLTDRRYDVIINDCTSVRGVADNASLYTREYFEIARRRLTPDGWFMSWMDVYVTECSQVMDSVMGTFMEVFPYVTLWYITTEPAPFFVIVGSQRPQTFSVRHITEELGRPAVAESLSTIGCRDSLDVLSCYVADENDLRSYLRTYAVNSDYSSVVEFCRERESAGPGIQKEFFEVVRRRSVEKHIDWRGVSEPEKAEWLARFEKVYDAATCMIMAESTADVFDRLQQAATGLRIVPGQPALVLIKHSVEQRLLESGLKLIDAGNVDAAKETARHMLEIDPNCAPAWVLRARVEHSLGDVAAAETAARHAMAVAPEDLSVQLSLWSLLVSANDTRGATAVLQAAMRTIRENPDPTLSRKLSTPGF